MPFLHTSGSTGASVVSSATVSTAPTAACVEASLDADPNIAPCVAASDPLDAPPAPRILTPVEKRLRVVNLIAVLAPIAGLAIAITLAWGTAFDWTQFWILVGMTYATSVGITVGYHRLFTHQSFKTNAVIRYLLAVLGSMAVQGAVIEWCGAHRKHHQHSDDVGDPHSPYGYEGVSWGSGIRATLRGFYHSHVGWLFETRLKGMGKYTPDLRADPVVRAANSQFYYWALAGLLLPTLLGGLLTWTWIGALEGLLWGGFVRILLVHHITWSVNSVCHLWGTSPFRTGDHSRNNAIVGVLALGEGWHNNHHAFPASARHGLRWWQFDPSYLLIRGLWLVGLASNVRVPDSERVRAKKKG